MDIKIAIEGIEIISSEIKVKPHGIPTEAFNINITAQNSLVPANQVTLSLINIIVWQINTTVELAKLSVLIVYKIDNFTDIFTKENEVYKEIPESINGFISSISISTVRGILFSFLKGTYLHNAILPIINISSLKRKELPQETIEEPTA